MTRPSTRFRLQQLSKLFWISTSLCLILFGAFAIWWFTRPTYLGHGMRWWLDYGMKDIQHSYSNNGVETYPGTPHKLKVIEAFRTFGEKGTAFLAESEFRDGFRNYPKNSWILETLSKAPWNKDRDLVSETHYRARLAKEILRELGISFQQAESLAQSRLNADSEMKRATAMGIYQCVTNQFDLLAITVAPYLTHTNGWIAVLANETMLNVGLPNAEPYFQKMISNQRIRRDHFYYQMLSTYAPHSPEIEQYLISQIEHKDRLIASYACLALLNAFPENQTYADTLIQWMNEDLLSLKPQLIRQIRNWPFKTPKLYPTLIRFIQTSNNPQESLPIISYLHQHQVDLSPLIPKLQSFLYFAPHHNGYGYGSYSQDLAAARYLLEMNIKDPKVWFYFIDLFGNVLPPFEKQPNKSADEILSLAKPRATFLHLLAPYHKDAANIIEKYPLAQVIEKPHMRHWQENQLIKHKLIPRPEPTPIKSLKIG